MNKAYRILVPFCETKGKISNEAYLAIPELQVLASAEIESAILRLEEEGHTSLKLVCQIADGMQSRRLVGTKTQSGFVDAFGIIFSANERLVGRQMKISKRSRREIVDAYLAIYGGPGIELRVSIGPTLVDESDMARFSPSLIPPALESLCRDDCELEWPITLSTAGRANSIVVLPMFVRGLVDGIGLEGMQRATALLNQMHFPDTARRDDMAFHRALRSILQMGGLPISASHGSCMPLAACRRLAKTKIESPG